MCPIVLVLCSVTVPTEGGMGGNELIVHNLYYDLKHNGGNGKGKKYSKTCTGLFHPWFLKDRLKIVYFYVCVGGAGVQVDKQDMR